MVVAVGWLLELAVLVDVKRWKELVDVMVSEFEK
jgi:hypothetical protein